MAYILPVSDDGGSTAEIVRVLGGPAVGDIRSRCLRLADDSDEEVCGGVRVGGWCWVGGRVAAFKGWGFTPTLMPPLPMQARAVKALLVPPSPPFSASASYHASSPKHRPEQ